MINDPLANYFINSILFLLRWYSKDDTSPTIASDMPLGRSDYLTEISWDLPLKGMSHQPDIAATKLQLNLGLRKDTGTFILLRGDAGVGKSQTAESFAAHVRKPLLAIGSGELRGSAKDAETFLAKYFRLAKTWDCILLFRNVDFMLPQG